MSAIPNPAEVLRSEAVRSRPTGDAVLRKGGQHRVAPGRSAAASADPSGGQPQADLHRILHLGVPVSVTLAEQDMPLRKILDVNVGVIIEFSHPFDAELDLVVGNCRIASGHAVKVGENFGLRIHRIGNLDERIKALGGT